MASPTLNPGRDDFQDSCWVWFPCVYIHLSQPCLLLPRPEIIEYNAAFILLQVPLGGLTHIPKFQSGGIFREGWASVVEGSLYSFAILGKKILHYPFLGY